jgi:hypothetical protein
LSSWEKPRKLDVAKINTFTVSKKYRQHNGQKKKYKRTNNDLQNIHIKLKIE